jgi:hypothetical protein
VAGGGNAAGRNRVEAEKKQQMVGGPRQYHLAASRRGEWPTPWICEIFHRGKPLEVRLWGGYFKTYNAAMRAGRPVFDEFLASCHKGKNEGSAKTRED